MRPLLLLVLLAPGLLLAAEPNMLKTKAEEFLGTLQKGDIAGAYDRLFQGSSIPKDKSQAVTLVSRHKRLFRSMVGYLGTSCFARKSLVHL
jgi:hypothetical protein